VVERPEAAVVRSARENDFRLDRPKRRRQDTLFNVITGVYSPDGGAIRFEGQSIGGNRRPALPTAVSPAHFKTFGCFAP